MQVTPGIVRATWAVTSFRERAGIASVLFVLNVEERVREQGRGIRVKAIQPSVTGVTGGQHAVENLIAHFDTADDSLRIADTERVLGQRIGHQAGGVGQGFQGQAADVAIQAKEIMRIRENINDILIKHTNQPRDKIQADIDRDFIMTPEQAKEYKIIDMIITTRAKSEK